MRKVTVAVPMWIGKDEAQEELTRDLRSRALLKTEYYRTRIKSFEAHYRTTFARFQKTSVKAREDFAAWDDLIEWESCQRAYREWRERHAQLRRWSAT